MKNTDLKPMAANKQPAPATDLGAADLVAQQAAAVDALARSMPHNANKNKEFGWDNAIMPPAGQTLEFVTNQYRHGKTILAVGAAKALLDKAGISTILASGKPDPGILLAGADALDKGVTGVIDAVAKHRHPERETDPPQV